jgi:hypothetical protein
MMGLLACASVTVLAIAQTNPTTAPTTQSTYDRLLGSEPTLAERPLQPTPRKTTDASTGIGAMAPGAPQLPTKREGTFIIDRMGRLSRSADGQNWEFTFDADGQALQDPPMKVLPNLKLMVMEEAIDSGGTDLRFRVSGSLTEYRGRNYILLEKVIVAQDR